jgi:uncharacterized membrane protein YphA (DoxX/SURF4 family)
VIATVCAVALGVVFVVAGATKVAAGAGWRSQAAELGAPSWVSPVLPWVELVLGALLVSQIARRWIAAVAVGLLIAFTALLVIRLREGRRPPCACFGAWSTRPLGWVDVARNGALVILGSVAIAAS